MAANALGLIIDVSAQLLTAPGHTFATATRESAAGHTSTISAPVTVDQYTSATSASSRGHGSADPRCPKSGQPATYSKKQAAQGGYGKGGKSTGKAGKVKGGKGYGKVGKGGWNSQPWNWGYST